MMNNHHVAMLTITVKAKQVLPLDSMMKVASDVMWYSGGTPIEDKHLFIDPMQLMNEQQKVSDTFTLNVFAIPRHPAQLYEAIFCLFFIIKYNLI
jgi:prolipoprotein diacylglyceryltransferase